MEIEDIFKEMINDICDKRFMKLVHKITIDDMNLELIEEFKNFDNKYFNGELQNKNIDLCFYLDTNNKIFLDIKKDGKNYVREFFDYLNRIGSLNDIKRKIDRICQ